MKPVSALPHLRLPNQLLEMPEATKEQSFKLSVPESELDFLRKKLDLVRFPDELEGAGRDYGAPLSDIQRLTSHWRNGFDWRKAEAEINQLPMFTRDIDVEGFGSLNIHYVHKKSDVPNAIPLVFSHGCGRAGIHVHHITHLPYP